MKAFGSEVPGCYFVSAESLMEFPHFNDSGEADTAGMAFCTVCTHCVPRSCPVFPGSSGGLEFQ